MSFRAWAALSLWSRVRELLLEVACSQMTVLNFVLLWWWLTSLPLVLQEKADKMAKDMAASK